VIGPVQGPSLPSSEKRETDAESAKSSQATATRENMKEEEETATSGPESKPKKLKWLKDTPEEIAARKEKKVHV
jgi:hypothetical protein